MQLQINHLNGEAESTSAKIKSMTTELAGQLVAHRRTVGEPRHIHTRRVDTRITDEAVDELADEPDIIGIV